MEGYFKRDKFIDSLEEFFNKYYRDIIYTSEWKLICRVKGTYKSKSWDLL